jgi:hypothetical protein
MKKNFLFLMLIALALTFAGLGCPQKAPTTTETTPPKETTTGETEKQKVTLIINDGETEQKFDFNFESGLTVLDLLKRAATEGGLELLTKQFDFGTSIEKIGKKQGGEDNKYWMYYIDGKQAPVSADKQEVKPGIKIEFKYEASNF